MGARRSRGTRVVQRDFGSKPIKLSLPENPTCTTGVEELSVDANADTGTGAVSPFRRSCRLSFARMRMCSPRLFRILMLIFKIADKARSFKMVGGSLDGASLDDLRDLWWGGFACNLSRTFFHVAPAWRHDAGHGTILPLVAHCK